MPKTKKANEPFFTGSDKNALVITGGWLVRSQSTLPDNNKI